MGKVFISFIIMINLFLAGCSNDNVKVTVNGEPKVISENVLEMISKKNEIAVKRDINPNQKGDIEIKYNGILHKIFVGKNSAIVYFKDEKITQYEISLDELREIQERIK
ncbi:hypothetical protein [Bacillus cereus group sp. TH152-1LC]|uniref:hypothetical protein n=1 Tax=Bacillus cereus group sp. TH152-1LC TaxID=3018060 RepID=UPI0022E15972|nr:hypothetical protein [Bacillus cereus group sp. TH152-1LC]MDA1675611.1 hypothetical protein [Bacillus cereus group sp. TH152-1LC]